MIVLGVRRDRIFGLADVGLFHSLLELFPYLPVLQVSLVLPLCALIFLVVLMFSLVASFHVVLHTNHLHLHPLWRLLLHPLWGLLNLPLWFVLEELEV